MKTYQVGVFETAYEEYDVEADSPKKAFEQIQEDYNNRDLEITIPRDIDTRFYVYEQDVKSEITVGIIECADKGKNNWKLRNILTMNNSNEEQLIRDLKEMCISHCKTSNESDKHWFRYRLGKLIPDSPHDCKIYQFENYPTD